MRAEGRQLAFRYEALQSDLSKVIADARALGSANIVGANIPHKEEFTAEVARKAAADFNVGGKPLKDAGISRNDRRRPGGRRV
jgi:hypothetical protein